MFCKRTGANQSHGFHFIYQFHFFIEINALKKVNISKKFIFS